MTLPWKALARKLRAKCGELGGWRAEARYYSSTIDAMRGQLRAAEQRADTAGGEASRWKEQYDRTNFAWEGLRNDVRFWVLAADNTAYGSREALRRLRTLVGLAPARQENEAPTEKVTTASPETRSWLQLLMGQPGEVVIERNGTRTRVSIDQLGRAQVIAGAEPQNAEGKE